MAESTWATREGPILEELYRQFEEGASNVAVHELVEPLGLEAETIYRSLEHLDAGGYLEARFLMGGGAASGARVLRLSPDGLRAIGAWPSRDATAELLLGEIEAAIEAAADDEERSRLQKLGTAAGEVGKTTLAAVVTAMLKQAAGLP